MARMGARIAFALVSIGIRPTEPFVRPGIRTIRVRFHSSLNMSSGRRAGDTSHRGPIILGSKSFTRRVILEEMAFTPLIRTADIDEIAIGDRTSDPSELVLELGFAKAKALLPELKAEAEQGLLGANYLLTADQVVLHEGRVLEKPADEDEVRRNIAGYARSPCRTVGSVVLTDVTTGKQVSGVDTAEISFAQIPESVVTQLCAQDTVFQCAGGLMVEHELVQPFVVKIEGTMDSAMGYILVIDKVYLIYRSASFEFGPVKGTPCLNKAQVEVQQLYDEGDHVGKTRAI